MTFDLIEADLGAYLSGTWEIERALVDHASGQVGTLRGTATFIPTSEGALRHEEHGELSWGLHHGSASRAWSLVPAGGPGGFDVYFEDGRFFHRLDLRTGSWTAEHLCGDDVYAGSFWIETNEGWAYSWTVIGPRKRLELTTRLTRRAGQVRSTRSRR